MVWSLTSNQTLFLTMAVGAALSAVLCIFSLTEPEGSFGEDFSTADRAAGVRA